MTMTAHIGTRGELRRQSAVARKLGSRFVAAVLEAGERQLFRGPRTAALVSDWPHDPSATALAMRFNAALHALARRGNPPVLAALYEGRHDDYDDAIATALTQQDRFIADWMRTPTQTNEVGRAASITAALMVLRRETGLPVELIELGSSCGLNLNLHRYAYQLGDATAGDPTSPVRIAPEWRGSAPDIAPIEVIGASGVDLSPLDPQDEATRERLLSFVWADQSRRIERLEEALRLARQSPPIVEQGNAADWLPRRLAQSQQSGTCRVIFHSMVLQYLTEDERQTLVTAIKQAGSSATKDRPLAWISFEWTPSRKEVRLTLTHWPKKERRVLAIGHPYGDWINWLG